MQSTQEPEASDLPGSLLEVQNLIPTEPESAF